jgi:hypothetical protein
VVELLRSVRNWNSRLVHRAEIQAWTQKPQTLLVDHDGGDGGDRCNINLSGTLSGIRLRRDMATKPVVTEFIAVLKIRRYEKR